MRVLHLFANYKFTGPADPALALAASLARAGVDVTFAAGRHPERGEATGVPAIARERGLPTIETLRLAKHTSPLALLRDAGNLAKILRRDRFDVVHCHLPADHLVAALATRRVRVPVVRTLYDSSPPRGIRGRVAMHRSAAALVFSEETAIALRAACRSLPADRVRTIHAAVDLDRFHPSARPDRDLRRRWGESATGDLLVGVIARMQTHRLFPELIAGFAAAARADPRLRLVVLGRGTNQETVAKEPARASGVGERIHFAGYIEPSEYPRAVAAFDALIFLVPGSDGTCRAAREALACGVPVVASRRGLLPTFVRHGENGLLLDAEAPDAIARALLALAADEPLRAGLARGAAEHARRSFDPALQVGEVRGVYDELIAARANGVRF